MRNPFAIHEDPHNPVPKEILGWRVYAVALTATWSSAAYGYNSAFIGGTLTLPSFAAAFGLNDATVTALSSNIVSTFQAGAFFGVIIGKFFSERFGRKWTVTGCGVLTLVGAVLQLIGDLNVLYVGRVLTGLGVGATTVIIPVYISECSPAPIRGRLVGIFEIMLAAASLCGFWVNYGVQQHIPNSSRSQWIIPVAVQFIPSGLLVIMMPFMIESPRWLVSKGRHAAALKALSWVRHLPADHFWIENELGEMQQQVDHEVELTGGKTSIFHGVRYFKDGSIRNRIFISMTLMLLQNLTGVNALNYYSPTIFKQIGFGGASASLLATGVYGIIKLVVTLIFMVFIVDAFGRRTPLLVGGVGCAITMFYLAGYTSISNSFNVTPPSDSGANAAIASIYMYAMFYSFSWSGIPWIFAAEVFPTHVRGFGMMCAGCMQWLSQFIVVYSLPYMISGIQYGTFLFFGACSVLAFIFAFFFVPETKGVVLEDMELLFGAQTPLLARPKWKAYMAAKEGGLRGGDLGWSQKQIAEDGVVEDKVETV